MTNKIYIFLIIVISLAIYLPINTTRDFHPNEELKYVQVAKEMRQSNNWIIPQYGGKFYSHKPPFYFWIVNLFKVIFNKNEVLAVSLISIFSSIILLILSFNFAKLNFNIKDAFISTIMLMVTVYFYCISIIIRMDMLMAIFIFLAILFFYLKYTEDKYTYHFSFAFMGLAILIKGPAGFLIPFATIILFLILDKNLVLLKKWNFLKGFISLFIILLIWLVPAVILGGEEYAQKLLIWQTLGRTVKAFHHDYPFYYYFLNLPLTLFPWGFLTYSYVIYCLKNIKNIKTFDKFLLSWILGGFIVFSLISGKLDVYLIPIYPAAIMGTYSLYKKYINNNLNKNYLRIPFILNFIIILTMGVFLIVTKYVKVFNIAFGIIIILLSIISFVLIIKNKYLKNYILSIIIMMLLFLLEFSNKESLNKDFSIKDLTYKIKEINNNGGEVLVYKIGDTPKWAYYTEFFIDILDENKDVNEINENLNNMIKEKEIFIVTKKKHSEDAKNLYPMKNYYDDNRKFIIFKLDKK